MDLLAPHAAESQLNAIFDRLRGKHELGHIGGNVTILKQISFYYFTISQSSIVVELIID